MMQQKTARQEDEMQNQVNNSNAYKHTLSYRNEQLLRWFVNKTWMWVIFASPFAEDSRCQRQIQALPLTGAAANDCIWPAS